MAGAGKRRHQDARKGGSTSAPSRPDVSETEQPIASYDGPSDAPNSNPFGPGLGYDPAKPVRSSESAVPRNLEVPASAYQTEIPTNLPRRPKELNSSGKPIAIRVNQFKVVQWPQKDAHQYDVLIGAGRDVNKGLIKAAWNSQAVQTALKTISPTWIFDGERLAWCFAKAPRSELRILVDLDKERGKAPRQGKNGEVIDNTVSVRIRWTTSIRMAVISAYLQGTMEWDDHILAAINFLDHVMRQYPSEMYTKIKRSFFGRGEVRFALDNCVEAMKGVYSSMRLCQPIQSLGLAVNVDVANGTFWASQTLHQAARNYCKERNPRLDYNTFGNLLKPVTDARVGFTMSRDFKELRKLTKLRFYVKHRGKEGQEKIYSVKEFVFDPAYGKEGAHAKNVKFNLKDGTITSVFDYFKKTYNLQLEYWWLPVVRSAKDGFFPMELCTICPNQRYVFKTTPDQTANMIKFAVTRPKERIAAIQHGVQMLKWDQDPYLQHFGIKIDPNMTVTNGRLLPNPEVQYAGSKVNPGVSGRWDLRGKKFLHSNPSPLVCWGVAVIGNAVDQATLQNFIKVFITTYQGHGGNIQNRSPTLIRASDSDTIPNIVTSLRTQTGNQSKQEPQILLFVLPDKNSATYERLKKNLDCRYGIVSQMMQAAHVRKANPQYCSNVCMKLNAKLGGTTCKSTPTAASKIPNTFFKVPTLIVGADVSHPSPGSPQASMAALTVSMDADACRYAAAVQTNGYRVEMITKANIRTMFIPLVKAWILKVGNNKGPQHIYYFRDGVSEGQYAHVLQQEVQDMKDCIKEQWTEKAIKDLKFTVVVCSKRHHVRLLPRDHDNIAGDKNGNPHPGTLVERDVTHPFEYDFYLNSHSAIQGTARPVHYQVIMDDANVSANLLQNMINSHCYQYMRSTTPVSLYPAVYYAHLASNRARAHEDVASSEGPRGGQKFVENLQAQAGKGVPVKTLSSDNNTEAKPLVELGGGATEEHRAAIKLSMWYI